MQPQSLPPETTTKLLKLQFYFNNLPAGLPIPTETANSSYTRFHPSNFRLDQSWVSDSGTDAAVNREFEVGFGPRDSNGNVRIVERGECLEAAPKVLRKFIEKSPYSFELGFWLDTLLSSAEQIYKDHGVKPPDCENEDEFTPSPESVSGSQHGSEDESSYQHDDKTSKRKSKSTKKKLDTKIMKSYEDEKYTDLPDYEDDRTGGQKILPLLLKVSRLCVDSTGKRRVRCLCSRECKKVWSGEKRDRARVLEHASSCGFIAAIEDGLFMAQANEELAKSKKKRKRSKVGAGGNDGGKESGSDSEEIQILSKDADLPKTFTEPSARKRQKFQWNTLSSSNPTSESNSKKADLSSFRTEGKQELLRRGHDKLVKFLACNAIAINAMGDEFKEFCAVLNGNYIVPSTTTIGDSLVPKYAADIKLKRDKYLRGFQYLQLTFDGGQLQRFGFYSVSATTPRLQTFTLELDDGSRLSHTGDYIRELLRKWINPLGVYRIASICSDNTGNTNRARRLISEEWPHIIEMLDVCHHLNNTMKDICRLPVFKKVIESIRDILSFMSHSKYTEDHFDDARKEHNISRGLEAIGDTRFSTLFWSGESILRGIPAFVDIVRNTDLEINAEALCIFAEEEDTADFQIRLRRFLNLLRPFARALQCLEATSTTPADVYRYWLAILAQIHDMFITGKSKMESKVIEEIRQIVNARYSEIIEGKRSHNIYITAFFLEPENRSAKILSRPNPIANTTVTIPGGRRANTSRSAEFSEERHVPTTLKEHSSTLDGITKCLVGILRREYGDTYDKDKFPNRAIDDARKVMEKRNPYLAHLTPSDALKKLKTQLADYIRGEPPFVWRPDRGMTPREWWLQHIGNNNAHVLAVISVKIFSCGPNSMNEERAVSLVSWINSARRNRQKVSTVTNQLVIHQWERMDEKPVKKPSIKWRDMRTTINPELKKPQPEGGGSVTGQSRVVDPLKWLDDEKDDKINHAAATKYSFDIQQDVDITSRELLDILSDSAVEGAQKSAPTIASSGNAPQPGPQNFDDANPEDSEWDDLSLDIA